MRILTLLALMFFTSNLYSQTKTETIDWINSKIPKNPLLFGDVFKSSQKMKISQDGTFEVVSSDYEIPVNPSNPKAETTTIIKGNFKDFNPSSVKSRREGNLVFIDIKCYNSKECITTSQTGKEGITYIKDGVTFGAFNASESNIEERLKKAFSQLIISCGGKKEAY